VLLHPLGADLVVWEPVLGMLAAERDVVAPDLPGFGDSPPLPDGAKPTPGALAASVAALMDELGLDRAHLAGNSLGAWVALELAIAGRGDSVTGLAPAGFWERPLGPGRTRIRALGRLLLPLLPLILRTVRGRRLALGGTVMHPARIPPQQALRLIRAYVTAPGFEAANLAMRSAVFEHLDEVPVPVTLAWAERDRLVTRPKGELPGVRSLVLHGCGHVPTWDDPEQVARVLLEGSSRRGR
jgi:pimeloyl-ACP methyl ester carboxylesterase